MEENLNKKIDNIYETIGELGKYQFFVIIIISSSAIILSNSDYSYNLFIGATPDFR